MIRSLCSQMLCLCYMCLKVSVHSSASRGIVRMTALTAVGEIAVFAAVQMMYYPIAFHSGIYYNILIDEMIRCTNAEKEKKIKGYGNGSDRGCE